VLLDPFAGVGGNAIQFARTCRRVLASDSSSPRLRLARHNAGVYGLKDGIEFRCMDFSAAVASLEVTVSCRSVGVSYFCCLFGVFRHRCPG
jgi:tRNA/tmRNA/rRNA uracil-C5-methylase (TrmA/RlmC/RlmD family)